MSCVHNYVLLCGCNDGPAWLERANIEIRRMHQAEFGFVPVDQHSKGPKVFEADVWIFAGNYVPLQDVARILLQTSVDLQPTVDPTLVYHGPEDDAFRAFDLADLQRVVEAGHLWREKV